MPFVNDDRIVVKWEAVSFVQHQEEFDPEVISGRATQEWKSGDYRWGGYETDYYVFIRLG